MPTESATYWGIVLLAAVTYATRVVGYLIGTRISPQSRLYHIIQTLPGCALCAIVAPTLMNGNPLEITAIGVAIACFHWTENILGALLIGLTILIAGAHLWG